MGKLTTILTVLESILLTAVAVMIVCEGVHAFKKKSSTYRAITSVVLGTAWILWRMWITYLSYVAFWR